MKCPSVGLTGGRILRPERCRRHKGLDQRHHQPGVHRQRLIEGDLIGSTRLINVQNDSVLRRPRLQPVGPQKTHDRASHHHFLICEFNWILDQLVDLDRVPRRRRPLELSGVIVVQQHGLAVGQLNFHPLGPGLTAEHKQDHECYADLLSHCIASPFVCSGLKIGVNGCHCPKYPVFLC